jgi:hypothetical protein
MAKLTSLLKFSGSLDGLSAFKMEGIAEEILRRKGGLTKEQIQNDPCFALTRANNKETAGRSRASGLILDTLGGLRPAVDQSCAGRLNALLKAVQEGDTLSPLREHHLRLPAGECPDSVDRMVPC